MRLVKALMFDESVYFLFVDASEDSGDKDKDRLLHNEIFTAAHKQLQLIQHKVKPNHHYMRIVR